MNSCQVNCCKLHQHVAIEAQDDVFTNPLDCALAFLLCCSLAGWEILSSFSDRRVASSVAVLWPSARLAMARSGRPKRRPKLGISVSRNAVSRQGSCLQTLGSFCPDKVFFQ